MLEVLPGPQWTTDFGSILIQTAGLLRTTFGHQEMVIPHTHFDEEQSVDYYYADCELMILIA